MRQALGRHVALVLTIKMRLCSLVRQRHGFVLGLVRHDHAFGPRRNLRDVDLGRVVLPSLLEFRPRAKLFEREIALRLDVFQRLRLLPLHLLDGNLDLRIDLLAARLFGEFLHRLFGHLEPFRQLRNLLLRGRGHRLPTALCLVNKRLNFRV